MARRPFAGPRRAVLLVALLAVLVLSWASGLAALSVEERPLYKDLGLTPAATKEEIKRAFRRLTRENHPDTKESAEEKETAKRVMAQVLRAYEVLSDPMKRADYDASGFVPGEVVDPKHHSAEDLFRHYNQQVPIFSKTEMLESLTVLNRIKNYRGRRVSLIQIYDDASSECQLFSGPWETLSQASLVAAGVLRMYRVDAKSPQGPALIKAIGTWYRGRAPAIVAFVDGEKWSLYGLEQPLKRKQEGPIFEYLMAFVMSFFYEVHVETRSLPTPLVDNIVDFLAAPRSATPGHPAPLHILVPPLAIETLSLTLHMHYGAAVVVRTVPRAVLMEFVEQHCEQEVVVYDRRGEVVPMPEFLVVSTEALGAEPRARRDDAEDGEEAAAEAGHQTGKSEGRCKGVHIGASASLTYAKASEFVRSLLPASHAGLPEDTATRLTYLNAEGFATACERNCVMWVRESCAVPEEDLAQKEMAATASVMANDFLSFKPGYLCLDEQPAIAAYLARALPGVIGARRSQRGPLLIAIMDSDETTIYAMTGLMDKAPLELETRDVDVLLSSLLDSTQAARTGTEGGDEHATAAAAAPAMENLIVVEAGTPLSTLLPTAPFPMSTKQRYTMMFNTAFALVWPYVTNVMPFFFMWLFHTQYLNKKRAREEAEAQAANGGDATAGAAAPTPAPSAPKLPRGFPTGKRPVRRAKSPEPPKPKNMVSDFTAADWAEAQIGKGFLVLLLDDRPLNTEALKLPLILSDSRFTVRTLSASHLALKEWLREQLASGAAADSDAAATGAAGAGLPAAGECASDAEKGLALFAVRKGRMQGVMKPEGRDIESFMRDLLDGTVTTRVEIPASVWS